MIFGEYPCCNGHLCLSMPEKTPAYFPENCPHCGAKVWHRLSRVESMSWTEEDFLNEHDVDTAARTITAKPATEAEAFDMFSRQAGVTSAAALTEE
ncbi:MAG TPA: hypothetical protein VKQ27_17830 [Acetobacteraceae bacterium]|nr:hypothetical protein [Acetobacteraceae bacterium]